jgi:hypothetical protein
MAMKTPNPVWPFEVKVSFIDALSATPLGCGGCANAEWRSKTDAKGYYFVVAACRSGIQLLHGEPTEYCTARKSMLVPASSDSSELNPK